MTVFQMIGTCKKLLNLHGIEEQELKAVEEMAELTKALVDKRCSNSDVITEIADVCIMMKQLSIFFGEDKVEDEIKRKLERAEKNMLIDKQVEDSKNQRYDK
ncbi:MAG: hypothetical protein ACI3YC_08465 [Alloprevotella sp.]